MQSAIRFFQIVITSADKIIIATIYHPFILLAEAMVGVLTEELRLTTRFYDKVKNKACNLLLYLFYIYLHTLVIFPCYLLP